MIGKIQKTFAMTLGVLLLAGSMAFAAERGLTEAEQSFILFKNEWISKLNRHCKHGIENAEVLANGEGLYVARYTEVAEQSLEVKATGVKESPFVGILRYHRATLSAEATTKEDALNGPFKTVSLQGVTEIFRYSNGKWMY